MKEIYFYSRDGKKIRLIHRKGKKNSTLTLPEPKKMWEMLKKLKNKER